MRWVVAIACFGLIIARAAWPEILFDNISLTLLVITALAVLLPDLRKHLGPVKKVKIGPFEVDLGEKLEKLAGKTAILESSIQERKDQIVLKAMPEGRVPLWLAQGGTDPRASLLLLTIEIERTIRNLAKAAEVPQPRHIYPLYRLLGSLAERQIVDKRLVRLFRDFWAVRNTVVHGHHFEISEGKLYELIELGLRILRILKVSSVRPSSNPGDRENSAFIDPWSIEIPGADEIMKKINKEEGK